MKLLNKLISLLKKLKLIRTKDISDGYHTFDELYHHRAMLFSIIVNEHKEYAWKSLEHHDGSMFEDMFIVGIDTPRGQYTYHYNIEPYWELFDCKVLKNAPIWDGHKPSDIDRLLSLVKKHRSILLPLSIETVTLKEYGANFYLHDYEFKRGLTEKGFQDRIIGELFPFIIKAIEYDCTYDHKIHGYQVQARIYLGTRKR